MAGPFKLDDPQKGGKAVKMLAKGQSMTKVARTLGVGVATVSRWVSREDVQARIEEQARQYAEALPDAVQLSKDIIRAGKIEAGRLSRKRRGEGAAVDYKLLELGQREAECLRKSTGLQPSGQTFATNNFFLAEKEVLSPVISRLLAQAAFPTHPLVQDIDVTPEGDEDQSGTT